MDRDSFMSAMQALEFGIIDRILEKREGDDPDGGNGSSSSSSELK